MSNFIRYTWCERLVPARSQDFLLMQIMFPTLRKALGLFLAVGLVTSFVQADSAFRDMRGNLATFDAQQSPGQWTVVMIWASARQYFLRMRD